MRLVAVIEQEPDLTNARQYSFLMLDGLIGDLQPWAKSGGHGTVSGMSNFAPLACVRLWDLCNKADLSTAESMELSRLHTALALADVEAVPSGVRGMSKSLFETCTQPWFLC